MHRLGGRHHGQAANKHIVVGRWPSYTRHKDESGEDPEWGQRGLNSEDLRLELKFNDDLSLSNSDLMEK
jgi:hypothetical protein